MHPDARWNIDLDPVNSELQQVFLAILALLHFRYQDTGILADILLIYAAKTHHRQAIIFVSCILSLTI